jgi:peptidoglycan-associated lipoprotein
VKDYLVSLGVSGARLETISYGKERPICSQSTEACWAQNRRGLSTIKSGAVS